MKIKIGILGTRGIPNAYGGFEQFAQYLSERLVKRGYDVSVYNSSLNPYIENDWHGVNIIRCRDWEDKLGTPGQFFYDRNCINDARKRQFDVLLHLGYTSDSVWHWRWPKRAVHIVNMDGLEWKRDKYGKLARLFLKWAEFLAVKNAQVLVADSTRIREHLSKRYGRSAVYIPYGADIFRKGDETILRKFNLFPHSYYLLIARMEPENNLEMIIKGYLASKHEYPLLIIGNTGNKYGTFLTNTYRSPNLVFAGPVFDQEVINNLRFFSARYFHGHSVGGTNPSLLEAMACGCRIAAHDNIFNRYVLQNEADYFSSADDIPAIILSLKDPCVMQQRKEMNILKINRFYNWEKIVTDYEQLILNSVALPKKET